MSTVSKSKTIKPPGSNTARVSVACDRCRKKKIRCFYDSETGGELIPNSPNDKKTCANCKAVGLECIFTDKLARKAFPRGYTESLEERVRELEYENKKLQKLIIMKDEDKDTIETKIKYDKDLNFKNLSALNDKFDKEHTHDENCGCDLHDFIHRPVSIAGSVDIDRGELSDDDVSLYSSVDSYNTGRGRNIDGHRERRSASQSKYNLHTFEQINAPGAAAAISLQNKLRTKNFLNLANLIATSIPRSTEETLFIPTLLAKLIQVHGFDSKAPYLTARSIALLKEAYNEDKRYKLFPITFKAINFTNLKKEESIKFFQSLNLPNHINLDICISIFFNTWNTVIPVLNKDIFMKNYTAFNKSRDRNFEDGEMVGFEKFGELLIIITCLVMISNERNNLGDIPVFVNNGNGTQQFDINDFINNTKLSSNSEILQFYDHIIKQFIQSNLSSIGSISSLQIVTIELLYCLATGDLNTSYELRGRMITMCQQLRLHRCPAAVLGYNGSSVSKLQQGERRILFWCIYTLDSFSAFILGVPRLLKDYEIECALPSSSSSSSNSSSSPSNNDKDSDINLITFRNNTQLSLVGKVCDSALGIMRYAKVLGTIVDTIFKRNTGMKQAHVNESTCLLMEDMLDNWMRQLPETIAFDVHHNISQNSFENYNISQLTLMYLYYQAKALIYMPLLTHTPSKNANLNSKGSPAFINIQNSTTNLLTITKTLNSSKFKYFFLPLPMNISRQKARFALLAARNSLEYTRGGALFQEAKLLLNSILMELKIETKMGLLGCLSENSVSCLDNAVDAILSQPKGSSNMMNIVSSPPAASKPISASSSSSSTGSSPPIDHVELLKRRERKTGSPLKRISGMKDIKEDGAINDIFGRETYKGASPNDLWNFIPSTEGANLNNISNLNTAAMVRQTSQSKSNNSNGNSPANYTSIDGIQSFSDLLMLNDFGVDASLGLPLLDFELESHPKKQKLENGYQVKGDKQTREIYHKTPDLGYNNLEFREVEDVDSFKMELKELNNELKQSLFDWNKNPM
ncbi:DNA-binding transcription factor [Martiniozyma asiatica (nom. inval.)]|nr:DNA-binding transcription factor [Martiniozyma asiatica]